MAWSQTMPRFALKIEYDGAPFNGWQRQAQGQPSVQAAVEAALAFAFDVLEEDGTFVAKVLAGGAELTMQNQLKKAFRKVANVKPPASRADSSEKFVVAQGFRGVTMSEDDDPRTF